MFVEDLCKFLWETFLLKEDDQHRHMFCPNGMYTVRLCKSHTYRPNTILSLTTEIMSSNVACVKT